MVTLNFIRFGDVTKAEQFCIDSWAKNTPGVPSKLWTLEDISALPNLPEGFLFLQKKAESLVVNGPQNDILKRELYAAMANYAKFYLVSAPKEIDGADYRLYVDTDVLCLRDMEEFLLKAEEAQESFVGKYNEVGSKTTDAVMGGPASSAIFSEVSAFVADSYKKKFATPSIAFIGGGFFALPLFERLIAEGKLIAYPKEVLYGMSHDDRTTKSLEELVQQVTEHCLTAHLWFNSYGNNITRKEENLALAEALLAKE